LGTVLFAIAAIRPPSALGRTAVVRIGTIHCPVVTKLKGRLDLAITAFRHVYAATCAGLVGTWVSILVLIEAIVTDFTKGWLWYSVATTWSKETAFGALVVLVIDVRYAIVALLTVNGL